MSKIRKVIKNSIAILMVGLLIVITILIVQRYKTETQEKEALLFESEKSTYKERIQVVERINNVYDYALNGYDKLKALDKTNILIISDSQISAYDKYEIKPKWQEELEVAMNKINNQDNFYHNILLRGSNIIWAFMQVSSDLSDQDFDFCIIEISKNDVLQLTDQEFMLYYEGLLRQLADQFIDIEIYVVMNDAIETDLNKDQLDRYKSLLAIVKQFSEAYKIDLLEASNEKEISKGVINIIEDKINNHELSDSRITLNPLAKNKVLKERLFNIKKFVAYGYPTQVEGFMLKDGLLLNSASNNYLVYEVEAEFVYLNYVTFMNGAEFNIYIDNKLYKTIDSYSLVTGVGVIAFPPSTDKRTIKIKGISEAGSGKYLMMDNLIIGK